MAACMCMYVRKSDVFWTKPPEGDKETHLEPQFGDWTNVCVTVSQHAPILEPVTEPFGRGVFILLYIHHLSLLRSHRPSCRTFALMLHFTTLHPGLLFCRRFSLTLSTVALWLLVP